MKHLRNTAVWSGICSVRGICKAMKLLCDSGRHRMHYCCGKFCKQWRRTCSNIVKIDGEYYHLDVTNNDSLPDDGIEVPAYSYFNLTDLEMMKFCEWDRSQSQMCQHPEQYHRYGLTAEGTASSAEYWQRPSKSAVRSSRSKCWTIPGTAMRI